MTSVGEVIDSYFRAANREDWQLMRTVWHPKGELRAVGFEPRHGIDDVLDYYQGILKGYTHHVDTPTRTLVSGNTVVAEIEFSGRLDVGTEIAFDAVDVFDLEDGVIRRLSIWYDIRRVSKLVKAAQPNTGRP